MTSSFRAHTPRKKTATMSWLPQQPQVNLVVARMFRNLGLLLDYLDFGDSKDVIFILIGPQFADY